MFFSVEAYVWTHVPASAYTTLHSALPFRNNDTLWTF